MKSMKDTLPLEELLQDEGWRMARRELERKVRVKAERIATHRYMDLLELREDQAELRILRQFLRSDREVVEWLAPRE